MGDEQEKKSLQMNGLNLMEKILVIEGARLAFTIWDVGGTLLLLLLILSLLLLLVLVVVVFNYIFD